MTKTAWLQAGRALLFCALTVLAACAPRYVGGGKTPAEEPQETAGSIPETQEERLPTLAEVEDEYAYVVEGIDFGLPEGLAFLHPSGDTAASGTQYYLTGVSDPAQELLINGEAVDRRGENGAFALFVPLEEGDNIFRLQQGEKTQSVTIRKGGAETEVPVIDSITKAYPIEDLAVESGTAYTLQCVAPAGSAVSARIQEQTVEMRQNVAAAQAGVPANFSAEYAIPETEGTLELGRVTYLLDGKEYPSEGGLFAKAPDARLAVQIKNVSSSVFSGPSVNSAFLTIGKEGAVDEVVDFGGDTASGRMYKLRMGGWIQSGAATPVAGDVQTDNSVSGVTFTVLPDRGREQFVLSGTARPFFQAKQDSASLTFRFYNTEGIEKVDVPGSALFSGAEAAQDGNTAVLTLHLKDPGALWGYLVEYDGGDTILTCLPRPRLSQGGTPLEGITVALDAGHGGTDTGTLGLPYDAAPMEKDVVLATAEALKKKLGLLGARVVMVRAGDENPTMNERMQRARDAWADFYISLHANSAGFSEELIWASGLEVYYFEPNAKALAETVSAAVSQATGRSNRGARQDNYRVTMQSFAPSIMVELGFMPNPVDFDSMCSPDKIYQTVAAITDSLVSFLSEEAVPPADGSGS